jgi:hypothetical protein
MEMNIHDLLKTLTPAQAKAWAKDPEQWLHVTDNYLDPAGLRRTEANVLAVEGRFIEIIND